MLAADLVGDFAGGVDEYSPAPRSAQLQLIFVAGPLRSGTNDDPWLIEANEAVMTEAALRLFRAGHMPVMGEWFAFPLMEHAGAGRMGDSVFNEIIHPIARRLIEKCDAILRVGGSCDIADELLEIAWDLGKAIYFDLDEVPPVSPALGSAHSSLSVPTADIAALAS
jgi:hypothetical protein